MTHFPRSYGPRGLHRLELDRYRVTDNGDYRNMSYSSAISLRSLGMGGSGGKAAITHYLCLTEKVVKGKVHSHNHTYYLNKRDGPLSPPRRIDTIDAGISRYSKPTQGGCTVRVSLNHFHDVVLQQNTWA